MGAGERPERVRGGRGRERNRERRGGRRREGDATSLSAEDSQGGRVGLPEGEEAPTMGASAAPRPHRGSQRRGPREPVPGEEGEDTHCIQHVRPSRCLIRSLSLV